MDLNKLKISTRKLEAEILLKNNGVDPDITEKNAAKSLGGVIVKTFQVSTSFVVIYVSAEFISGLYKLWRGILLWVVLWFV